MDGVETVLAGRSGSWEVDGVRQLLNSTVSPDEAYRWQHRTEPLERGGRLRDSSANVGAVSED